ncbi:uncharacterized protein LOC114768840 [Denticeps clupeoides]|uniref:uncharacterized protein LOC114768840 n=1 Tax=Denticeps clupeoides TaxID=299321 RepID=UPI0010A58919|nr:uncharacterized protein LOC114768840 [Denticeps clupeoides]
MQLAWGVLILLVCLGANTTTGKNGTQEWSHPPVCQSGFYCPEASGESLPCPRGTFGPNAGGTSVSSCLSCLPHHYSPWDGMVACMPCGPWARQPLAGQDRCICQGEGKTFQPSDGQCTCMLGYRPTRDGEDCVQNVYDICKDRQTRTEHGQCLDQVQWRNYCTLQVCQSPEEYQGYDMSLGVCVCRSQDERGACGVWCRSGPVVPPLRLDCTRAQLQLINGHSARKVGFTDPVLKSVFKYWHYQGALRCQSKFSSAVYTVQTNDAGFFGQFNAVPDLLQKLFLQDKPENKSGPLKASNTPGSAVLTNRDNSSDVMEGWGKHWSHSSSSLRKFTDANAAGVWNPISCLHLGDILLFIVTKEHYPQYDVDNLFNTNAAFDWGQFRHLAKDLQRSSSSPAHFTVAFSEPGVYAFRLSSHHHKHMYVKVLPAGGECYETGTFFPALPQHLTRMGVARRRHLLLRPDWFVIGGLMLGAGLVLGLCVTLLVVFWEHAWPEKMPIQARYRLQHLRYHMDDYASKGSRVTTVKKAHRNAQSAMTVDSMQKDEFWDYEEQVDLEAFSSSTFYEILLKHSLSVTTHLGQLRREVKELYQEVVCKVQGLQPTGIGGASEGVEHLRMGVEREAERRQGLGVQLSQLTDAQLQALRAELRIQRYTHQTVHSWMREGLRLLGQVTDSLAPLWDGQREHLLQTVAGLAHEMTELVTSECHRQGAWAVLKEATGARLLCPKTGTALSKDDIISADGTIRANDAVHMDPCTGLILPNPGVHMHLANSSSSMPVPSDFFLHPQTGRLLPMAGNVAFDPSSSTLVFTSDSCWGDAGKWELPLLPFIPYPPSQHTDHRYAFRLKGLRPGQKLQLGGAMCDQDTGVLVPIMAVTIHPQTRLVYPLGGVYICPITRLYQPIQIGSPMLDPRTGNLALITGISLDPITGVVLPVGGLIIGESFIEPLSGRPVRVGGATVRGGRLVPHSGGFQALLDSQALGASDRAAKLLLNLSKGAWGTDTPALQGQLSQLLTAAAELDQAWRSSHHCSLQLICRIEAVHHWALGVAQDGGSLGEIQVPGTGVCLPALLGMEYPDPGGSGLNVPVLGAQLVWELGDMVALAGTMEDAEGKGLVPIRLGALAVDPVTGVLAPVVGVRLDVLKKTVVPVTVSQYLAIGHSPDTIEMETLQNEVSVRSRYWKQQRKKEEELLGDLLGALRHCLYTSSQQESHRGHWSDWEAQLGETVQELQERAQRETQRRAVQAFDQALLLAHHVQFILTEGEEEEWEQQCEWQAELESNLSRINVCVEQMQREVEEAKSRNIQLHEGTRQRELWEQLNMRQAETDSAFTAIICVRELSQIWAETAQAVLSGAFWYRDFSLTLSCHPPNPLKMLMMTQCKIVPQLERLLQQLEDNEHFSLSTNTHRKQRSGLSAKQTSGIETSSREWTASVSAGKDTKESPNGCIQPDSISIPALTVEEWSSLLQLSPLFQLLCGLEQEMRRLAGKLGLFKEGGVGKRHTFLDLLDAQLKCEGHLTPISPDNLTPREFLVYQHGQFLLQKLHSNKVIPALQLQLACTLPSNNDHFSAFGNSFFYKESESILYVRRQRLQSVGGFSLVLVHSLAHISLGNLTTESCPAFQRAFFKVLQICFTELFCTRLECQSLAETGTSSMQRGSDMTVSLLERAHKLYGGHEENDVMGLLQKHKEASLFLQVESLLKERSCSTRPNSGSREERDYSSAMCRSPSTQAEWEGHARHYKNKKE